MTRKTIPQPRTAHLRNLNTPTVTQPLQTMTGASPQIHTFPRESAARSVSNLSVGPWSKPEAIFQAAQRDPCPRASGTSKRRKSRKPARFCEKHLQLTYIPLSISVDLRLEKKHATSEWRLSPSC